MHSFRFQFGLHGKCQSNYAIEEDTKTNDWTVTQVVDVTNCREKAEMFRGMAHAVDDKLSEEVFSVSSLSVAHSVTADQAG